MENYKEVESLLKQEGFFEEFKKLIEKYKYEDIRGDKLDADVRQEFNDAYRLLVRLYQCDFAVPSWGDIIHIINLKMIQ